MKPIIFKLGAFILLIALMGAGCKKDIKAEKSILKAEGLIFNSGEPHLDGCGWQILIKDTIYSPIKLDDKFQKDDLMVNVEYHVLTTKRNCAWSTQYSEVEIIKISNK
jgi:hypothetical protein